MYNASAFEISTVYNWKFSAEKPVLKQKLRMVFAANALDRNASTIEQVWTWTDSFYIIIYTIA